MKHLCHAAGCPREVPPHLLMCGTHWRMVPYPLQRDVWRHYRSGQEADKQPSDAYLTAARAAIDAVAEVERTRRDAQPGLELTNDP